MAVLLERSGLNQFRIFIRVNIEIRFINHF